MIYAILGQTASGKTDLAIKLARELNLPLIGCDVYQMYQELNIGSAKPSKEELEGVDYHLIDSDSIEHKLSVKEYQARCRELIDEYTSQGKDVIISGGTLLYLRSVIYPYQFNDEEAREDSKYEKDTNLDLYNKLLEVDEEAAKVLDVNNRRRVIRALEIFDSGEKKSDIVNSPKKLIYPIKIFVIDVDKEVGNQRIADRVQSMFDQGLVNEVKELSEKYDTSLPGFDAIGYKELIHMSSSEFTLEQIKEKIIINTRQYAKRQRTFLRHQFKDVHQGSAEEIHDYIVLDDQRRKRNKASLGLETLSKIEKTNAVVVGVGGVGSILAEALVRMGINRITVIDKDVVDPSNLNRQFAYTSIDIGKPKVEVLKKRLLKIDPKLNIDIYQSLYKDEFVPEDCDVIFDCVDDALAKVSICLLGKSHGIKVIHATGSGLRKDSTKLRMGFLSDTGEPLAKRFKKVLKENGVNKFNDIKVTYSSEIPAKRRTAELGSNVLVPNAEGLAMLSYFIKEL